MAENDSASASRRSSMKEKEGEAQSKNVAGVEYKQFKLFSAILKEAALDTPSFRAMVNHMDSQLMKTEKWITAVAATVKKIPGQVRVLENYLNEFLEYLVPLVLQDGYLDEQYTFAELRHTKSGLKNLWKVAIAMVLVSLPEIERLQHNISKRVAAYQQHRRRFMACQEKYDRFLLIHMATPKSKEPALVKEDLLELYAAHKEYLQLSLDAVMEMIDLGTMINESVSQFNYLLWSDKVSRANDNPAVLSLFQETWTTVQKIRNFYEHFNPALKKLEPDLLLARKNTEEHTNAEYLPPANLNDYRTLSINFRMLHDPNEQAVEKHGYLFMKTWVDRLSKPVWVRRWAFVQGGVFGFLVLSPTGTSVQETDKIGLLLCSTKYAPNEDRRFCFELKTMDTTLVLQVQTMAQLKLWLTVFENSRRRIADENDPMHQLVHIASGRYPPLVMEFLSSLNSVMDRDITNTRIVSAKNEVIMSSRLSAHIEKNEKLFQRYVFQQVSQIAFPMVTELSRPSLIAYSLTGETAVPTALCANLWGSRNWGVFYVNDMVGVNPITEIPKAEETRLIGEGMVLPKNYPNKWVARDVQMRALFESILEPEECCLVLFLCLLSPNPQQELRSTVFITQSHFYAYINTLGFISLLKAPVNRFAEAKLVQKKDYEVLKVTHVAGLLKLKLFLEDGKLLAEKLNCVFTNDALDKPLGVTPLIEKLVKIETDYNNEKAKQKKMFAINGSPETKPESFERVLKEDSNPPLRQVEFESDVFFVKEHVVKMPPQALFHVLFGIRSSVLDSSYKSVSVSISDKPMWYEDPLLGHLTREFNSELLYYTGRKGKVRTKQEIEHKLENEYYSVKTTQSNFKVNYGPEFRFVSRFIIEGIEGGKSKMKFFSTVKFDRKWICSGFFRWFGNTLINSFYHTVCTRVDDAAISFGNSGKIVKAIYYYGKIPVADVAPKCPPTGPARISLVTIVRLVFRSVMTSALSWTLLFLWNSWRCFWAIIDRLTVHFLLLMVIGLLTASNVFLCARNTLHYWNSRAATGLVKEMYHYDPVVLEKALYVKDMETLISNKSVFGKGSECMRSFENQSFVLNYNQPVAWENIYNDGMTRGVARQLKQSLQDIGVKRNQLLVSLRMLNDLEQELAFGEWRNWLLNELSKCDMVLGAEHDSDVVQDLDELQRYCRSCSEEFTSMGDLT